MIIFVMFSLIWNLLKNPIKFTTNVLSLEFVELIIPFVEAGVCHVIWIETYSALYALCLWQSVLDLQRLQKIKKASHTHLPRIHYSRVNWKLQVKKSGLLAVNLYPSVTHWELDKKITHE
jgi:hypothetical protein